jgi:hypothetical protein
MLIVEHFWSGVCKQTGADDFNPTKGLAPQPTGMRSLNARVREGCNRAYLSFRGLRSSYQCSCRVYRANRRCFIFEIFEDLTFTRRASLNQCESVFTSDDSSIRCASRSGRRFNSPETGRMCSPARNARDEDRAALEPLFPVLLCPGKYSGKHFNPVPQILQPKVLVRAVLIVIVIGNRQSDDRGL